MTNYRNNLPQLNGNLFLTDGGIETTLIFLEGFDLPEFAAFDLLKSAKGRTALRDYFRRYAKIAAEHGTGFIFETPTWRSNPNWAAKIGYSAAMLAEANRAAVALTVQVRDEFVGRIPQMVISGCVGPSDDGYRPSTMMTAAEATRYHAEQVNLFATTEADMVMANTMTYPEEAIGVVEAAKSAEMPVVISFTVETDGRLPNGQTLQSAIEQVDAVTDHYVSYFMLNYAHPTHFTDALSAGEVWTQRIRGLRANASRMSHKELDNAEELDEGNPVELGEQYRALMNHQLCKLNVMGGCCGTDHRHIAAIAQSCLHLEVA